MFGARLGELDAYVPVPTGESAGRRRPRRGCVWLKNDYGGARPRPPQSKLVFVNFTGYACTNCHWMKANMFTRPEIAAALKGFILVDLYTDGTDAASEENQKLELAKFNTVADPYYAILDPDEKVIATFPGLTKDPAEFLAFLQKGAAPPRHPQDTIRGDQPHGARWQAGRSRRQGHSRQLLGDLVCPLHSGNPRLQQTSPRLRPERRDCRRRRHGRRRPDPRQTVPRETSDGVHGRAGQ